MKRTLTLLIALAGAWSPGTQPPIQASGLLAKFQPDLRSQTEGPSEQQIKAMAEKITVTVFTEKSEDNYRASGILIARKEIKQNNQSLYLYLVLTNDHVIKGLETRVKESEGYRVQTSDNKTHKALPYKALPYPQLNWEGNDLGLLVFSSRTPYEHAKLGNSNNLKWREKVFVAGFPCEDANTCRKKFIFTFGNAYTGLIEAKKHLDAGYQLGFTNETKDGMSGGPVLDGRGLLVGINGRGKDQDMGLRSGHPNIPDQNPYAYMNREEPPKEYQEFFKYLAWAVPIETYKKYVQNPFSGSDLPKIMEIIAPIVPPQTPNLIPSVDENEGKEKNITEPSEIIAAIIVASLLILILILVVWKLFEPENIRAVHDSNADENQIAEKASNPEHKDNYKKIAEVEINQSKGLIKFNSGGIFHAFTKNTETDYFIIPPMIVNPTIVVSMIVVHCQIPEHGMIIPETTTQGYKFIPQESSKHNKNKDIKKIWNLCIDLNIHKIKPTVTVDFISQST